MYSYILKLITRNLSMISLALFLTCPTPLCYAAEVSHCPSIGFIHYDKKSIGRYAAKTTDSTLWQSFIMAGLNPTPLITFLGAIAVIRGNSRKAAVIFCNYRIGRNLVSLKGDHSFFLGKGWQAIGGFYFCAKDKNCEFSRS